MCGIVGRITHVPFDIHDILESLKRLEYRGYDSFGIATAEGDIFKATGYIDVHTNEIPSRMTSVAISHTRWATHGKVTRKNAHPHVSQDGTFFIVHNGIIENHAPLRKALQAAGHTFLSQTDSEVIVHYIEERISDGTSIDEAISAFMNKARGTFAALLIRRDDSHIYAFKRDSPLVLGILDDGYAIASDIYAFSDTTTKAVFFEDDEYAVISADSYAFFDARGAPIEKEIATVRWTEAATRDEAYDHFMIKEIHEQPVVARRLILSLENEQAPFMDQLVTLARTANRVLFVAAGTSYHASLIGVYLLNAIGVEAHTLIASEFHNYMLADEGTLVVAISQSGETMDVVKAVKYARSRGSNVASIVNVPYSTIQRLSDISIEILAGQEICVASTKTYTNQILVLARLAQLMGLETNLDAIPDQIEQTLSYAEPAVIAMAPELRDVRDIYVIGRGIAYPLSREVALKLKEISYIHAEGMMGGELKHGTIALIEDGTIVMSFIQNADHDTMSNIEEVEARGARVISISDNPEFSPDFLLPASVPGSFAITATIVGQLFSYYIAKEKGLPIDKPRNLAKSVTVK
ncbi:MAG TPA: glutamine--fructose-6-phosphate transaminase (isomerizing) [Methanomicrobia archaeon]|nr:glutamine--fructose-6-phosphate transaminase (isomerizing) [Methanomicrobia archaeon]